MATIVEEAHEPALPPQHHHHHCPPTPVVFLPHSHPHDHHPHHHHHHPPPTHYHHPHSHPPPPPPPLSHPFHPHSPGPQHHHHDQSYSHHRPPPPPPFLCARCKRWNFPPPNPYPYPNVCLQAQEFSALNPNAASADSQGQEIPSGRFDTEEVEDEEEGYELVMTDEWVEFFAKSEARRQEKKRQQKKDARDMRKATRARSQAQELSTSE